ncbi:MAG: methyltransferase domain-containing protein [Burkholderiaceae bacterium]
MMQSIDDKYQHSQNVVDIVLKNNPMHRKFLFRALENLTHEERNEVENYLDFLFAEKITIEEVAASYLTIVEDTFREELRFRETGRYRFSTFAEAQAMVYNDDAYMSRYMIGLALSSFWWSNHMKMRRFFQEKIPLLSTRAGIYREVGPGHGMYFLESMRRCNFSSYEGIDISPTSVQMTSRIIDSGYFGTFPNARIILSDFLDGSQLQPSDALIMGEVLEHVENPGAFLRRAYETTTADPFFFLTTCINAPAIDHLYNPESVENLEKLFNEYGFFIKDRCIVPRDGATLEECQRERLAINVAYVLGK